MLSGYYNVGLRICRYISKANDGIKCEVVPTTGSVENLELLRAGQVDFAFALSTIAIDAYNAKDRFSKKEPLKEMSQLLRLGDEAFTVIVREDSGIKSFADLEGKKISNGPPPSDSSTIYDELVRNYNFSYSPEDIEIFHESYAKSFCNGDVDAVILVTEHPNALVNLITNSCKSDYLSIEDEKIDLLLKKHSGFHKVVLKAEEYPGLKHDQQTVATSGIFVVSNKVDKKIVANFLDYFDLRIARFKASDPALYNLPDDHFKSGFILPEFKKEENTEDKK